MTVQSCIGLALPLFLMYNWQAGKRHGLLHIVACSKTEKEKFRITYLWHIWLAIIRFRWTEGVGGKCLDAVMRLLSQDRRQSECLWSSRDVNIIHFECTYESDMSSLFHSYFFTTLKKACKTLNILLQ